MPLFSAGLANLRDPVKWQGCVVISGLPSTGKTYLAITTLIDNALAGWDSWYFTCEMSQDQIRERGALAVASAEISGAGWTQGTVEVERAIQAATHVDLPGRFNIVDVGIGVTVEDLIEFLAEKVTERPTLVCLDSVSSFIDNMTADRSDAFGMAQLREVTRWVTGVARLSHGQIAFLILSELNKENRPKGRSLDHRSNCAISMTPASDEDGQEHLKTIRCTKNWDGPIGRLGNFALWHQLGRLQRIDEGPL
jgi:predicted ATP-dependent serine protease